MIVFLLCGLDCLNVEAFQKSSEFLLNLGGIFFAKKTKKESNMDKIRLNPLATQALQASSQGFGWKSRAAVCDNWAAVRSHNPRGQPQQLRC